VDGWAEAVGLEMNGRPPGSNPFRRSRGPLAAILPVFSRRFQFLIPVGLNLLLASGQHIFGVI
jgi:hypothetical protein